MTKEELIKKHSKDNVQELERWVDANVSLNHKCQAEMYGILYYLEFSKRYKENQAYKKSTFETYLMDRFNIRRGTYDKNVMAYMRYPDEAQRFGVGLVAKIRSECGAVKTDVVFKELKELEKRSKKPLSRDTISKVIDKHRKPRQKKAETDWKTMYNRKAADYEALQARFDKIKKERDDLKEQVKKLKLTADKIIKIRDMLEPTPGQQPSIQ